MFSVVILAAAAVNAPGLRVERKNDLLEFTYAWPAEAEAIPALATDFRQQAQMLYQETAANARDGYEAARDQGRDFHRKIFSTVWTSAGETPGLLSLRATFRSFSAGANQNGHEVLRLWDRQLGASISFNALLAHPRGFAALQRKTYCQKLSAKLVKYRLGMKPGGGHVVCPKFADLAIAPVDQDGNGRFETIAVFASEHVAGSQAEGEYEIRLPVTRPLVLALQPQYRSSFEAHPRSFLTGHRLAGEGALGDRFKRSPLFSR